MDRNILYQIFKSLLKNIDLCPHNIDKKIISYFQINYWKIYSSTFPHISRNVVAFSIPMDLPTE